MCEANAAVEKRQSPRSWRQFSVRSMLIVWIGLGLFAGWAADRIRQRLSVDAVRQVGGDAWLDPGPFAFVARYCPAWLGEGAFGKVVTVQLTGGVGAKTLAELRPHLERFSELTALVFTSSWPHAELRELPPLPNLEVLSLTMSGPVGKRIAPFGCSPRLSRLRIDGAGHGSDWSVFGEGWPTLDDLSLTGLDDAGAESLAKHLRGLSKLHLRDCKLSERGLRAIASIPGLNTVAFSGPPPFVRRSYLDRRQLQQRMRELQSGVEVTSHDNY